MVNAYVTIYNYFRACVFFNSLRFSIKFNIKRSSVCLFVCFNSSETAPRTSIKLDTIDHHPVVSVIRVLVRS